MKLQTLTSRGGVPAAAPDGPQAKKRRPTCALCKNHGLVIDVKGHKIVCKYQDCVCVKCRLVSEKKQVMAEQVALKRAQDMKKKLAEKLEQQRQLGIILTESESESILQKKKRRKRTPKAEAPDGSREPSPCAPEAGGLKSEDASTAERAIGILKREFGTSAGACTNAYLALLKSVNYSVNTAYDLIMEAEVLREQFPATTKFDTGESRESSAHAPVLYQPSSSELLCNGAQTSVRSLALNLRGPVSSSSAAFPPPFGASFMASPPPAPVLGLMPSSYNCGSWGYWNPHPFFSSSAAGAPPNGHLADPGPPLYFPAATPPGRVSEVLSSENSRGSAEYGSDKEGGRAPSGVESPPAPRTTARPKATTYMPYKGASTSPCKDARA